MTLQVTRTSLRTLRGDGAIDNERGARVAHRVLFARGPDCAALADGVGVWASLVLDAETRRPPTAAAETQPAPVPVAKPEEKAEPLRARGSRSVRAWTNRGPPPPPPEKPAQPEWFLQHEEGARTLEVGVSGFLMTGAGVGAMAGPSPYVFIEAGHGVFLRPSLAFAQSMTPSPNSMHGTWLGSRFDTCLRMSGTYSNHAGLQIDLCGGTDVGITAAVGTNSSGDSSSVRRSTTSQSWLAFAAVGPSVDFARGTGRKLGGYVAWRRRHQRGSSHARRRVVGTYRAGPFVELSVTDSPPTGHLQGVPPHAAAAVPSAAVSQPSFRPLSVSIPPSARDARAKVFRALYEDHVDFVWRNLRRLGVHDSDAEDRTQEVFVVAHRRFDEFEDRGHGPRAWLFQIVLRVASDARRHHRRHPEDPDGGDACGRASVEPGQAEALARREALSQLDEALRTIDVGRRTVLLLHEIEENDRARNCTRSQHSV